MESWELLANCMEFRDTAWQALITKLDCVRLNYQVEFCITYVGGLKMWSKLDFENDSCINIISSYFSKSGKFYDMLYLVRNIWSILEIVLESVLEWLVWHFEGMLLSTWEYFLLFLFGIAVEYIGNIMTFDYGSGFILNLLFTQTTLLFINLLISLAIMCLF